MTGGLPLILDEWPAGATVDTYLAEELSDPTRYQITDPHLRFWLSFVGPHVAEIERGRGDLVASRIRSSWHAWRGRAIEPVIRESLLRLPGVLPEQTNAVGGYWTRTNDPEIDIVGADREPVAKRITMVGSIKWLERRPFDARDLSRLIRHREQLPGADDSTALVAVSRAGTSVEGVRGFEPAELIGSWPAPGT